MPAWLTTVLLAALLTLLSYKLAVRGVATYKQESKDIAAAQHEAHDHQVPVSSIWSCLRHIGLGSRTEVRLWLLFTCQQTESLPSPLINLCSPELGFPCSPWPQEARQALSPR